MGKITPEELVQNLQEFIQEDLNFDPPQARRFYTTNIFQRTLAHIVGWTPWGARMLRCTSAGELKTAPTTTGIENYLPNMGYATDAWVWSLILDEYASRFDFFVWDNPISVRFMLPTEAEGDAFEVSPGFYSVDIRSKRVKVKNKTEGQIARFQIIGWW